MFSLCRAPPVVCMRCGCLHPGGKKLSKTFSRRIIWRDLAYWQLHHWPDMAVKPIRQHYEGQVYFTQICVSSFSGNSYLVCFAICTLMCTAVKLHHHWVH